MHYDYKRENAVYNAINTVSFVPLEKFRILIFYKEY